MYVQHPLGSLLLFKCLFTLIILFLRRHLLSVFLKHKTCVMDLYWACTVDQSSLTSDNTIYTVYIIKKITLCQPMALCCPLSGYISTSVCTHPNALPRYFKSCVVHVHTRNIENLQWVIWLFEYCYLNPPVVLTFTSVFYQSVHRLD